MSRNMSKKDFIALANLVREMRPVVRAGQSEQATAYDAGAFQQWEYTREKLAEFCRAQNPSFMENRWLDYIAGKCGPNGGSK